MATADSFRTAAWDGQSYAGIQSEGTCASFTVAAGCHSRSSCRINLPSLPCPRQRPCRRRRRSCLHWLCPARRRTVSRWWLTTWTPSPKWRQASAPWCRAQLPQVSNKRHGEGGKRGLSDAQPKETPRSPGSVSHLDAVLLPMRCFSTPEVQFFGPDGRDRIRQSIDADWQQSQALAQLEDNLRAQNDWESADSIAQRLVQFWDLF